MTLPFRCFLPQVLSVPDQMLFFDKGPLLSAKAHDVMMITRRLRQVQEICQSVSSSGLFLYKLLCTCLSRRSFSESAHLFRRGRLSDIRICEALGMCTALSANVKLRSPRKVIIRAQVRGCYPPPPIPVSASPANILWHYPLAKNWAMVACDHPLHVIWRMMPGVYSGVS